MAMSAMTMTRTVKRKYRNSYLWLPDTFPGDKAVRMRTVMAEPWGWCNVSPCFKHFFLQYS